MGSLLYFLLALIIALSIHGNIEKSIKITDLKQQLHDQQADNENLRFQYNQCKILHIGV